MSGQHPQLLARASRRELQDAASTPGTFGSQPSPRTDEEAAVDEEESGFADPGVGQPFFSWFVLVGVAWCIYHGCKPGGCCRPGGSAQQAAAAQPGPVGPHQLAMGVPSGQVPPGQQWTPAIDPRTGLAVAHVHIGQQAPVVSARPTRPTIAQKVWPTAPSVSIYHLCP